MAPIFSLLLVTASLAFAGVPQVEKHFRNTYYYVALESVYAGLPKDAKLRKMDDTVIAEVSHQFKAALAIEGTGRLIDGRIVNYGGVKDHETRYVLTRANWGFGVGTCELKPFRTIAVDPRTIPLGAVVRIEETVGMVLPDGTVHDGLWRAEDIGGAIKGQRIDLFVGDGDRGDILTRHGIDNLQPLSVTVVTPPSDDSCVNQEPLLEPAASPNPPALNR